MSGTSWVEAGWSFTGDVFKSGNYVEMRLRRANFGSPTTVPIDVVMLNDVNGDESTYSGFPSSIFADGYNPFYAKYLSLDLVGPTLPRGSPILP